MAYVAWCRVIVGSFGSGCCFGIASHAGDSSQLVLSCSFWSVCAKVTMQLQIFQGLVEFLQEQTNDHISDSGQFCRRWPLLLCGTLNFNGRKGLMETGLYSFKNGFKRGMERYLALTSIHTWWIVHSMLGLFPVQPSDNSEFDPFQWHFLLETSPFLGFHVATLPWSRGWPAPSLRTVAIARSTGRCCSCSRNALERWDGMWWSHRPLKFAGKSAINRGFDG